MITLYDCATAPSPRRARILLAEKGVQHATVNIDLGKGEQLGEAYRAINPGCTVPALRLEDGSLLTDNAAIAAYAEARWLVGKPADIEDFTSKHRTAIAEDIDAAPVFMAKSSWEVGYVSERYTNVQFQRTKERG